MNLGLAGWVAFDDEGVVGCGLGSLGTFLQQPNGPVLTDAQGTTDYKIYNSYSKPMKGQVKHNHYA